MGWLSALALGGWFFGAYMINQESEPLTVPVKILFGAILFVLVLALSTAIIGCDRCVAKMFGEL